MNISLAQIGLLAGSAPAAEAAPAPRRSQVANEAGGGTKVAGPAGWQGPQHSMATRIDNRHRVYYEVINNDSGEVVYQIPAEVVRQIGDGIAEFLQSVQPKPNIDVKT